MDYNDTVIRDEGTVEINQVTLENTRRWTWYMAIFTIASGIISCIGGIVTYGASVIPGIIAIILGLKLKKVKDAIDRYQRGDRYALDEAFSNISSYFKIQVILSLVSLIFTIAIVVLILVFGLISYKNGNTF